MLSCMKKAYSRPRSRKKTSAFTMVEILVALAILATSMLAVFGVLRMCVSAENANQKLAESVLLAEKLLAETTPLRPKWIIWPPSV